ncbi:MAG: alpha-glucan family phosphorylase [Bacteroidales bacterium]|nr:alpha-glucan family phosphorylase [Bacteroidales bacterium]MDD4669900.1 alpha-glucan family phosphorylase [Bacteroidales bacterium]
MKLDNMIMPDYLFEISWEVCNKVGGIHTVIATKSLFLGKEFKKNHIHIGPDVWRDTAKNPEFVEDPLLFRSWRMSAAEEGLRIRVGRWNVTGKPVAILVDFTQFIPKKDEILTDFWKKYGVDSLSGNWDYIESALFGYAAGKVIESYVKYNLSPHDKVVAQFHEWMTGAGLLYLKGLNLPIGTIFTTHATVVGRCIAGKNRPLYDQIQHLNADELSREFGVTSRHSLEKASAVNADVFTTVSEITAVECKQFLSREVDIITPNGFENSFTPSEDQFSEYTSRARKKLIETASAMSGQDFSADSLLVCISGRYEYSNKGIDVFIDALSRLNTSGYKGKRVLAFIMVPSGNNGPDKELSAKIQGNGSSYTTNVTHYLMDDYDVVINRLKTLNLINSIQDKVQVFFVPTYLNGNDGIFNMSYYDLLIGMDLSVFPSYYEPWGYTPLESLAFKVPTATTSLAGFGLWVQEHYPKSKSHRGIEVIQRNDTNYDAVVNGVVNRIVEIAMLSPDENRDYKDNAKDVSKIALWENNIIYYKQAYSLAIQKVIESKGEYPEIVDDKPQSYGRIATNSPSWARVLISRQIPKRLQHLDSIAKNLWWCWNQEAIDLFGNINPELWKLSKGNPLALLDMISLKQYKELEKDDVFLQKLDNVYKLFSDYMEGKNERKGPNVAYFCMEYGLDTSLKIYSGGLGILAGDYLKEASDMKVNMTAVGLLYRYGYFTQHLSAMGDQISTYEPQDFMKIPATPVRDKDNNWVTINVAFPGRNLSARVWRVDVGRTELYLLDTDFEDNLPEDRQVTYHLYGGDWENRLKQELLLGVGGIRALRALGIEADVYHCNEGHAAFMGLERLREYVEQNNLSFPEAVEVVRASSLFTTHTPVPAGHDSFSEDLLRAYIAHYPSRLKMDWQTFIGLGKSDPCDPNEKFSMSFLAATLSQEVNGVSWLHGKVSRNIFAKMWPGYLPEELNVSYVTNGVHYPTWTAPEWKKIHAKVFGDSFATHHYDKNCFEGIYQISNKEIWETRQALRAKLIAAVKNCMSDTSATNHYSPRQIVKIKKTLRDDILTIGFARRFATYKRATLLFSNLDRLNDIVNNPDRPVQFLFAGKAHPADKAGQDLIKRIVDISKMPQFIGKIVFVPNYDITIAKLLVQGVDVWMNNPTRPLEASGTSGEKAVMNGVMHFSVLDGWWVEGYKQGAGWALPMERTYDDQNFQDDLDAATIYTILENEIAPTFYDKDKDGFSADWIQIIKNTIARVACNFTTNRMMSDYLEKYYIPLDKRQKDMVKNDFHNAREMAFWKKKLRREWSHIEILSFVKPDNTKESLLLGRECKSELVVSIGDLEPEDIGVELILAEQNAKGDYVIKDLFEFKVVEFKDGIATYRANVIPDIAGTYQLAGRMYAKNKAMPHRQDFELVRWL